MQDGRNGGTSEPKHSPRRSGDRVMQRKSVPKTAIRETAASTPLPSGLCGVVVKGRVLVAAISPVTFNLHLLAQLLDYDW